MVKNLFVLFSLFLTIQFCSAQDKKFGIIGGANYSTLVGDVNDTDFINIQRRLSFHLGLFAEVGISQKFTFSPRLLFSSQGLRSEGNISAFRNFDQIIVGIEEFESIERANYLNIPLFFNFNFAKEVGLNFGPQLGFLINTSTITKIENSHGSTEKDKFSVNGDFKLDYGVALGLLYNFSEDLFVELNYYQGISNISRNPDIRFENKNNNSVFQLSVGYVLL